MTDKSRYIRLQVIAISSSDGKPVAEAARVVDRDTSETKVTLQYVPGVPADYRKAIQGVLSKNINMFGKGEGGSIRWNVFKKGGIEHWVFAAIELERRGFKLRRDRTTREYTKEFIEAYLGSVGSSGPSLRSGTSG